MSEASLAVALCWAVAPASALRAAAWTGSTNADERTADGVGSLREAIVAATPDHAVDACSVGDGINPIRVPAGTYALTLAGEDGAATGDSDFLWPTVLTAVGAMRAISGADTFGAAGGANWLWRTTARLDDPGVPTCSTKPAGWPPRCAHSASV